MIEDIRAEVYGIRATKDVGSEVAVKIVGGKVIRFPTDEYFVLGEPMLVRLVRTSPNDVLTTG